MISKDSNINWPSTPSTTRLRLAEQDFPRLFLALSFSSVDDRMDFVNKNMSKNVEIVWEVEEQDDDDDDDAFLISISHSHDE